VTSPNASRPAPTPRSSSYAAWSYGLLAVRVDPDDRRRQIVQLTSQGSVRLDSLTALHRDELRRFRDEMNSLLEELER
jgi:hypothetical protein